MSSISYALGKGTVIKKLAGLSTSKAAIKRFLFHIQISIVTLC